MSVERQNEATKSHVDSIMHIRKKPCKHTICKAFASYTGGYFYLTLIRDESDFEDICQKKICAGYHRADFFLFYLKILANIKPPLLLKHRCVRPNQPNALNNPIRCHTNLILYMYYRLLM